MTIHGISQSSWVERVVEVERTDDGVLLTINDRVGGAVREGIVVSPDNLLPAIVEPLGGSVTIEGRSPVHKEKRLLDIEVRGNEVQLNLHGGAGEGCDVAVGLDDFQDALEGVIAG